MQKIPRIFYDYVWQIEIIQKRTPIIIRKLFEMETITQFKTNEFPRKCRAQYSSREPIFDDRKQITSHFLNELWETFWWSWFWFKKWTPHYKKHKNYWYQSFFTDGASCMHIMWRTHLGPLFSGSWWLLMARLVSALLHLFVPAGPTAIVFSTRTTSLLQSRLCKVSIKTP